MSLDISAVTNSFNAQTVIIAVLAVATVLMTIGALLLACFTVLSLLRGDDWEVAYLSKGRWKQMGFDSADDHQNYRRALADDDTDYYWRSKKDKRGNE